MLQRKKTTKNKQTTKKKQKNDNNNKIKTFHFTLSVASAVKYWRTYIKANMLVNYKHCDKCLIQSIDDATNMHR